MTTCASATSCRAWAPCRWARVRRLGHARRLRCRSAPRLRPRATGAPRPPQRNLQLPTRLPLGSPPFLPPLPPLPAGALAGNPFGVDRRFLARELGFEGRVCPNSMDAGGAPPSTPHPTHPPTHPGGRGPPLGCPRGCAVAQQGFRERLPAAVVRVWPAGADVGGWDSPKWVWAAGLAPTRSAPAEVVAGAGAVPQGPRGFKCNRLPATHPPATCSERPRLRGRIHVFLLAAPGASQVRVGFAPRAAEQRGPGCLPQSPARPPPGPALRAALGRVRQHTLCQLLTRSHASICCSAATMAPTSPDCSISRHLQPLGPVLDMYSCF